MMNQPTFAEVLRDRRITLGMSQRELADIMGTAQSQISEYENENVQPTLPIFEKWTAALYYRIILEDLQ